MKERQAVMEASRFEGLRQDAKVVLWLRYCVRGASDTLGARSGGRRSTGHSRKPWESGAAGVRGVASSRKP